VRFSRIFWMKYGRRYSDVEATSLREASMEMSRAEARRSLRVRVLLLRGGKFRKKRMKRITGSISLDGEVQVTRNAPQTTEPSVENLRSVVERQRPNVGGSKRSRERFRHNAVHPRVGKRTEDTVRVFRRLRVWFLRNMAVKKGFRGKERRERAAPCHLRRSPRQRSVAVC
jgi:hypothetical protein